MTSLLDTLEGRGLVERHPHPSDRRKVLIHLTAEARARVADLAHQPPAPTEPRRRPQR